MENGFLPSICSSVSFPTSNIKKKNKKVGELWRMKLMAGGGGEFQGLS